MVPFGVFVGVKIIKLKQSHCQFVSAIILSYAFVNLLTENII